MSCVYRLYKPESPAVTVRRYTLFRYAVRMRCMMKKQTALCLCCAAVLLFCGCRQNSGSSAPAPDSSAAETTAVPAQTETAASSAGTAARTTATLPAQRSEPVKIRVSSGGAELKKPAKLGESDVFLGFSEADKVAQIGDAADGTEFTLTPESVSVRSLPNTVYSNAVYVPHAKGTVFSVPVVIGGKAEFSLLELEISYDSTLFECTGITDADGDAACNHVAANSTVYLSFTATENVQADVGLCTLHFRTKTDEKRSSALKFDVKDIAKWNADRTVYEAVPYETAGGGIVTY